MDEPTTGPAPDARSRSRLVGLLTTCQKRPNLVIVLLTCALFAIVELQSIAPVGHLTRDINDTAEVEWYLGAISSIGVIGWSAAATLFAVASYARAVHVSLDRAALAFLGGATLSTVLLFDDLFQVHEELAPRLLGSELPVYAVYALSAIAWLWYALSSLPRTSWSTMAASAVLLGSSVGIDTVWHSDGNARLLLEDGAKFAGIWLWASLAAQAASHTIVGSSKRLVETHV